MKNWHVFYLGSLLISIRYEISGELRHLLLGIFTGFIGLYFIFKENK